ncbi:MAG: metal-dependent hydrolase [Deltaproteobacteria bacterium RIFCSPLOWO2_02_44_9]|nr:MAG: metal-dependent hydrolase [Deltaproteobacteria bacterium RIFCSPLOWO2_02_44_9]
MLIRCWGSRGSIPVSGSEYIKYGGDTTCLELRTKEGNIVIIDAGSGIRRLGNNLVQEGRKDLNILFTHAHWDHILGFPFFKPLYFKGTAVSMLGSPLAQESIKTIISKTMQAPNFPVRFEDMKAEIYYVGACPDWFRIKGISITPIRISHPNQGMGYKFVEDNKTFVFLTDNELTYMHPGGLSYNDYLEFSRGADLLFHDAEYLPEEYKFTKTWGHSIYLDALNLALEAGVKRFGLFHHNQERTDEQVDRMVEDCRKIIREKGSDMECFAVAKDMVIEL